MILSLLIFIIFNSIQCPRTFILFSNKRLYYLQIPQFGEEFPWSFCVEFEYNFHYEESQKEPLNFINTKPNEHSIHQNHQVKEVAEKSATRKKVWNKLWFYTKYTVTFICLSPSPSLAEICKILLIKEKTFLLKVRRKMHSLILLADVNI